MTDSIDLLAAALKGRYDIERELGAGHVVTPDGKGVVYVEAAGSHGDVIVVHDWLHELKARLAGGS